ncbi:hypothetical protein AB1Y20_001711 [Prymnesium parvum]|uniref:Translin-associated factor X-interacting protein 1 N-terminal domain-containing protein n=1 Tax=Prymnesium parvum TaxID=97485 RepID=A0AB34KEC9_PRYPA
MALHASMRSLSAIPDVRGHPRLSPRLKDLLWDQPASHTPASPASPPRKPVSPPLPSPRSRRLPSLPTAPSPSAPDVLRALGQYMDDASSLPPGSVHRLQAARHVLNLLAAHLPTHGPLLVLIRQEYDAMLEPLASASAAACHTLYPVHPLQLAASYHEADLRHTLSQMKLVDAEVTRVARIKARLRAGILATTHCMSKLGEATPPAARSSTCARGAGSSASTCSLGGGDDADQMVCTPGNDAHVIIEQLISEEMEAGLRAELARLRAVLDEAETRHRLICEHLSPATNGCQAVRILMEEVVTSFMTYATKIRDAIMSKDTKAFDAAVKAFKKKLRTLKSLRKMEYRAEEALDKALWPLLPKSVVVSTPEHNASLTIQGRLRRRRLFLKAQDKANCLVEEPPINMNSEHENAHEPEPEPGGACMASAVAATPVADADTDAEIQRTCLGTDEGR